ncbi:MAG: YczE/YyaS/YitT family protein [Clostridium sp.]
MRDLKRVFGRLMLGFVLCGSSTVFMLNSNLGLSPWDVLHEGVSKISGMTIGTASVIIGVLFLLFGVVLGQKLGLGTILNMVIVGPIIDCIIYIEIIPISTNIFTGIIMMIIGMLTMGYGCYLYIGCSLGCGPRDGVMLVLSNKTNVQIKYIRGIIEVTILILGYMLGGTVGIGTFISAIGLGYCLQLVFKIKKFDAEQIEHKSLKESFKRIKV